MRGGEVGVGKGGEGEEVGKVRGWGKVKEHSRFRGE